MDAEPRQSTDGMQRGLLQVDRHRGVRRTRLDQRTRAGRRARELREHYTAALQQAGRDVSSVELISAISRASELQAISEELRASAMRGVPTSPDDLVRLDRLANLALRALRLPSASSKQTPTLGDLLRADHEQQIGRVP
jgi:hypothetical protein